MAKQRSAAGEKLLRIILVEDDPASADMVRRLLITKFEVLHASSLSELLDLGRHQDPDIILLDLRLGDGGDGDYITLVMKVVARFRDSAVIVLTGLDDETLALETLRAGAQDYLVKEMYIRDQMIKKILHAHARHSASLRVAESNVAIAAASGSSSVRIAAVDPDILEKKLEEMVGRILEEKVLKQHHLRPRTDVFEPIPGASHFIETLVKLSKANWKFFSSAIAVISVYVTDFRNTVQNTATAVEENVIAVQQTAEATKKLEEKTRKENEKMREGLIFTLVTTVKSTEYLQRMIQAAAPKTDFPSPPPELRAAQKEAQNIDAARALFEGAEGDVDVAP